MATAGNARHGALFAPYPLERRLRDVLTYVRQPNPDAAREAAGRAFAAERSPRPSRDCGSARRGVGAGDRAVLDDEALGCGGLIAALAEQGADLAGP
ncbi:hypothetical protein [uncultured Paracoccus sp.]|uniref:hypothetical protein n=1 Tax=uncultured Paracoccus sp. TaxID=189685 RepID=UPI002608F964|nr:hypothetical protein [uncultured Paracoccus sp.]